MEKVVKFCKESKGSEWEKLREKYKEDFHSYVTKRELEDKQIKFRNLDNRERM